MSELLDIYDEALNHLGSKERQAVHRDGDWHRVFHCWVIYRDSAGQDWVILQKRAATTETYPNYLDISAAGHYAAGESLVDGVRELEEELGITAQFEDLIPLGRRVGIARYGAIVDRQVADVFFYICDQDLAAYRYQESEIAGLVQVNVAEGLDFCAGKRASLIVPAVGFPTAEITVTQADIIPTLDNYFYKILVLARRCLNGEEHLLI